MGDATVEPRFDADAGTPEARRALHEQNRLSWDAATRAHNSHRGDQARFHREGGSKLHPDFREYDYSNGFRPYREMNDLGEWRWTAPDGTPAIPFMYSLVTRKAR